MASEIVFGIHAVSAVLEKYAYKIKTLNIATERCDERLQALIDLANTHGIAMQTVQPRKLTEMADNTGHQGVVAVCQPLPKASVDDFMQLIQQPPQQCLILILDGIQDPHNLGACIRVANAAEVAAIVIPAHAAAKVTAVVRKVASGACEFIPIIAVHQLKRVLKELKKNQFSIYGLSSNTHNNLYDIKFPDHTAIIMGAEHEGIDPKLAELCDNLLKIPMQGFVDSLNVSVACGVTLFEIKRQWQD